MSKGSGEPGWKWRRAMIFPLVIYGCWELSLLKYAADTQVNARLVDGWMLLIVAMAFFYTGFATVQDVVAIWRTRTGLPYARPQDAVEATPMAPVVDEPTLPGAYPQ